VSQMWDVRNANIEIRKAEINRPL